MASPQLVASASTSSLISLKDSKFLAKGPSNTSPTPSLNWIEQSHPGGGSLNVAQRLGEMTASLAAAVSLAL